MTEAMSEWNSLQIRVTVIQRFKYAIIVVDVTSRFEVAKPVTTKMAEDVTDILFRIYRRGPLRWPKLLKVDHGCEFMGAVSQKLAKHGVSVRRGRVDMHCDQGICECFNQTLVERHFGHQYAQEMQLPLGQRSTEWVAWLSAVVTTLNELYMRL